MYYLIRPLFILNEEIPFYAESTVTFRPTQYDLSKLDFPTVTTVLLRCFELKIRCRRLVERQELKNRRKIIRSRCDETECEQRRIRRLNRKVCRGGSEVMRYVVQEES